MAKICCGGFNIGDGLELDGKTLKATGGSGGGMVVNFTLDEDMNVSCDKSLAEISSALQNGVVNCVLTAGGAGGAYQLNAVFVAGGESVVEAHFLKTMFDNPILTHITIYRDDDDERWSMFEEEYELTLASGSVG